jgi:acyl-CoA reductase-like NAD-dependent aldehyde dehydrogenase
VIVSDLLKRHAPSFPALELEGSGEDLVVTCPWDGAELARLPTTLPDELDAVMARAQAAFSEYRWLPAWRRAEILREAGRLLAERQEEIACLLALEVGKPIRDARLEARRVASVLNWASEEAKRLQGEVVALDAERAGEGRFAWTLREPRGVIVAIAPFNWPINLAAHKVAPALAAGNAVVLKPASATPLTALWLAETLREAGLPENVLQVVIGSGASLGMRLVTDPRTSMISFTGSPAIGLHIAQAAGMKPVTLELGSNAATIVEADADLDLAVQRIAAGAFANSGQVCISVQRVLVNAAIYDQFLARLVEETGKLRLGHPLDEEASVSCLITRSEDERVTAWVDEALADGARLECGGVNDDRRLKPTVLTNVSSQMKVVRDEVFGPVVSVLAIGDLDEAIAVANDSQYGLQAGLFTSDLNKAFYAARRLEVGGVMINECSNFRVDQMPYGGVKGSGVGREGLKYAVQEMTEAKLITVRESGLPAGASRS